jgi:hypothetical protein
MALRSIDHRDPVGQSIFINRSKITLFSYSQKLFFATILARLRQT